MLFLLKGLLIGFAIAAPVGPIGVLVIRRTFADGRITGLVTGLGAATADAFYGAVAGFGLTSVSGFLLGWQHEMRLFGGLFLVALGLKTFFAKPAGAPPRVAGKGLVQAWLTTALLTATNPATILSFAAVFAGAGLGQGASGPREALALVAGVFAGSATWWLMLSTFIAKYRERHPEFAAWAPNPIGGAVVAGVTLGFASKKLQRINQVSGVLLGAFGAAALVSLRG